MTKIYLLVILLISFSFLIAECEFMGMISRAGQSVSWEEDDIESSYLNPEDPYDFFDFLYHHSPTNPDGYGVICYREDGFMPPIHYPDVSGVSQNNIIDFNNPPFGYAWYKISDQTCNNGLIGMVNNAYTGPFGEAYNFILDNPNGLKIVLGHVRNGYTGVGSHPFCYQLEDRYSLHKTYSFIHNGFICDNFKEACYNYASVNFSGFDSQWCGEEPYTNHEDTWIDSELLFLFIMAYIEQADYNVLEGLHNALSSNTARPYLLTNNSSNKVNFIFSDGEYMYVFCNYKDTGAGPEYVLYYKDFENYYGVITEEPSNTEGWHDLLENELVILSPFGETRLPEFMNVPSDYAFVDGELDLSNLTDNTFICGDAEISGQQTLDYQIQFAGPYTLEITGILDIVSGGILSLNHGAVVEIHGMDSRLFLDEGAIIEGCVPKLPQSSYSGIELAEGIDGDRIIARGGGIITTQASEDYNQNDLVVNIKANDDYTSWDGIYIKDPWTIDFIMSDHNKISFTNCEFDGVDNLQIYDNPFVTPAWEPRTIHFYASNFRNGDQVSVQDGHILHIEGIDLENNPCEFTGNSKYAVASYCSQLNMNNTIIGGNTNSSNLHGVYLYDSDEGESNFEDCEVTYNNGTGFIFNSTCIGLFDNISSSFNELNGIYCHNGTRFFDGPQYNSFTDVELLQNEQAEFVAWESESFHMGTNHSVTLTPYETVYPILINIGWEDGDGSVDIRGTDLVSNDIQYLLPADPDAWHVSGDINYPDEEMLLNNAALEIAGGDYSEADLILKDIIDEYPETKAAASSVYYLYQLTGMTDKDYEGLIRYLESIYYKEGSELEKAVKAVIAKSFMKEELYLEAIATIEDLIESLEDEDEIISAMIDEGYYYLQLAESGERYLPEECSLKVNSFTEYQDKVLELQDQISHYKSYEDLNNINKPTGLVSTNYPNPFNPSTTIKYQLPESSHLELSIYNIRGQKIKTLINEYCQSGIHSIVWDGNDANGRGVASGLYFYRIKTDNETNSGKLMLLK